MKQLDLADIKEVMSKDIVIGRDGQKSFVFNPQENEFKVLKNGAYVDGGQDLEELLNTYNELEA